MARVLLALALLVCAGPATGTYLRNQGTPLSQQVLGTEGKGATDGAKATSLADPKAEKGPKPETPVSETGGDSKGGEKSPSASTYDPACSDCAQKAMMTRLDKIRYAEDGAMDAVAALTISGDTNPLQVARLEMTSLHDRARDFYKDDGQSAKLKREINAASTQIKTMGAKIPKLQAEIELSKQNKAKKDADDIAEITKARKDAEEQFGLQREKRLAAKAVKEAQLAAAKSKAMEAQSKLNGLTAEIGNTRQLLETEQSALGDMNGKMDAKTGIVKKEITDLEAKIKIILNDVRVTKSSVEKCKTQIKAMDDKKKEAKEKKDEADGKKAIADAQAENEQKKLTAQLNSMKLLQQKAELKKKEMEREEKKMAANLAKLAADPNVDKESEEYQKLYASLEKAKEQNAKLAQGLAELATKARKMETDAKLVVKDLEGAMKSGPSDTTPTSQLRFEQLKRRHALAVALRTRLGAQHQVAAGALLGLGGDWTKQLLSAGKAGAEEGSKGDPLACNPRRLVAILDVVSSAVGKIKFEYQEVCSLIQEGRAEFASLRTQLDAEQKTLSEETATQDKLIAEKDEILKSMDIKDPKFTEMKKELDANKKEWEGELAKIDAAIKTILEDIQLQEAEAKKILEVDIPAATATLNKLKADLDTAAKQVQEKETEINDAVEVLTKEKQTLITQVGELETQKAGLLGQLEQLVETYNNGFAEPGKELNCDKDFVEPSDCTKFGKCKPELGCMYKDEPDADTWFCQQTGPSDDPNGPRGGLCKYDKGKCEYASAVAAKKMEAALKGSKTMLKQLAEADEQINDSIDQMDEAQIIDIDDAIAKLPAVDKTKPSADDEKIKEAVQVVAEDVLRDAGFVAAANDPCANLLAVLDEKDKVVGEPWARTVIEDCGSVHCRPCFSLESLGEPPAQCGDGCEYELEKVKDMKGKSPAYSLLKRDAWGTFHSPTSYVRIKSVKGKYTFNMGYRHRYTVDMSSKLSSELVMDRGEPLQDIWFKANNFGCLKGAKGLDANRKTDQCVVDDKCDKGVGKDGKPLTKLPPPPSKADLKDEQNGCGAKLEPIPPWESYNYYSWDADQTVAAVAGVQQVRLDYRPMNKKGTGLSCLYEGSRSVITANSALIITTVALAVHKIAMATHSNEDKARFACKFVGRFQTGIEDLWVDEYRAALANCRAGYIHNEVQKIVKFVTISDAVMRMDSATEEEKSEHITAAFNRVCHHGSRRSTAQAKVQLYCGVDVCKTAKDGNKS